ncbi:MAG TPA: hypothetical protein DDZ51_23475 [Planctomycetaceae bacterium]|nr:hypothetical protein [Planctomycetaceae bacterium]
MARIAKLGDEARDSLRIVLLTPTQARHRTPLPRDNQKAVLASVRTHALSSREPSDVVDLLTASSTAAANLRAP